MIDVVELAPDGCLAVEVGYRILVAALLEDRDSQRLFSDAESPKLIIDIDLIVGRSLAVEVGYRLLIPVPQLLLEDRDSGRLFSDVQSQSLIVAVEWLVH